MSFEDDETGIESSRPREGFEFVLPTVTYRLTSAVTDVTIDGATYTAGTIQRAGLKVTAADGSPGEIEVTMLVSHALPQRYLRGGVPPQTIAVNVYRQQLTSGERVLAYSGVVTSMRCDGHLATFLVAQRFSDAQPRRLPTVTVGRECPHVLYDTNCRVDRSLFKVATTVTFVDGRDVTLASNGGVMDNWAKFGELLHVASGERMTVSSQFGTAITLQLPLVDLVVGDSVELYAGCDRSIGTCHDKFANVDNFGGYPQLPKRNPFISSGYGLVEQE